jgi:hypothetical protein
LDLNSPWVNVEGKLGLVALYGGSSLRVDRTAERRGGRYRSLYVDEFCLHAETTTTRRAPGETLIDVGFAVLSGADAVQTAAFEGGELDIDQPGVRGVWAIGADGWRYILLVNWSDTPAAVDAWGRTLTVAPDRAQCRAL